MAILMFFYWNISNYLILLNSWRFQLFFLSPARFPKVGLPWDRNLIYPYISFHKWISTYMSKMVIHLSWKKALKKQCHCVMFYQVLEPFYHLLKDLLIPYQPLWDIYKYNLRAQGDQIIPSLFPSVSSFAQCYVSLGCSIHTHT